MYKYGKPKYQIFYFQKLYIPNYMPHVEKDLDLNFTPSQS